MAIRIGMVVTGMNGMTIGMVVMGMTGMTGVDTTGAGITENAMNARREDGGGVRRNGGVTAIVTIDAVSI